MSYRPCPTCKTPVSFKGNPCRPFCSERCRLIDLGRWASEAYVVSGKSAEVEETNLSTSESEPSSTSDPSN